MRTTNVDTGFESLLVRRRRATTLRRGWWAEFVLGAVVFSILVVGYLNLGPGSTEVARTGPSGSQFWALMHVEGIQARWYASLDEMTSDSFVVVVGKISAIAAGRTIVAEPEFAARTTVEYLNATLTVESVLHGTLATPNAQRITVELVSPGNEIAEIASDIPDESAMLFLWNNASIPGARDLSEAERADQVNYYTLMGAQAVLINSGGVVQVPNGIPEGEFPRDLTGSPFQGVIAAVRGVP